MFHDLSQQDLATHVKLLGWLVLLSGLYLLTGAVSFFLLLVAPAAVSGDSGALWIILLAAIGIGGFMGLFPCISILAGYGLIKARPWSRVLGLVDGFFGLIWFPIGTILGVYAFWVLFQAEAEPFFNRTSAQALVAGDAPPAPLSTADTPDRS